MSLPQKIKIGGITYQIIIAGSDHVDLDEGESWGCLDQEKCQIILSDEISGQKQQEVLLHEILHAIVDFVELEDKFTEKDISLISKLFYQVLKGNKLDFN